MRHTRSEGKCLRCAISLSALLLWQCSDGDAVTSSGIGASAGNGAGATAGIGGATAGSFTAEAVWTFFARF